MSIGTTSPKVKVGGADGKTVQTAELKGTRTPVHTLDKDVLSELGEIRATLSDIRELLMNLTS